MCELELYICGEHDNIRAIRLVRCENAVAQSGLPRFGALTYINVMVDMPPREQGCRRQPRICSHVRALEHCPRANPGGPTPLCDRNNNN
ncbi:hypothetical protein F5Y15DRAFT_400126, partial [Xylariaceae sp. FL0016]